MVEGQEMCEASDEIGPIDDSEAEYVLATTT